MPDVNELSKTPLGADLATGVKAISYDQEITFTKYYQVILPLDGFRFWVKADLLSPAAMFNVLGMNEMTAEEGPSLLQAAPVLKVKGSFHYATNTAQEEAESYAINQVIFTALSQVQDLNEIAPNTMYIGEFQGVKFSFSSRGRYYVQADLHHYVGQAVYPDMMTQVVDNVASLDTKNVIVSNSLPFWLYLSNYQPSAPAYGFGNPLTLYPSFLVPDNILPPYGVVHVVPEETQALTGAPRLGAGMSHDQLCSDRVRITLWGTRNYNALDFIDCVNQFSLDYDYFGVMNIPTVRDEKRTQNEMNTIAQKKSVEFIVSYYQSRVNTLARQLITQVIPSFTFN